jgi:hypothetical protein
VTTRTDEISTAVTAVSAVIREANTTAERLVEAARNKAETAAEHGWAGVASNMEEAVERLENVVAQLGATEQSGQEVSTVLGQITEQMSSPEVVEHLRTAISELDDAQTTSQTLAAGSTHQTGSTEPDSPFRFVAPETRPAASCSMRTARH